jgi:hypothetical protein
MDRHGSTVATGQEGFGPYFSSEANAVYGTVPRRYRPVVIQCRGRWGTERLLSARHLRAPRTAGLAHQTSPPGGAAALLAAFQRVDNGTHPTVQCGAVRR